MNKKDRRIVCIGMGFLMEEIRDNYAGYLGEYLKDNMIATTLDEGDLERKRKTFPFEVRLGDNPGALRDLEPTMILFAPPPKVAADLTESDLLPYYNECREKGKRLPMLVVFPPVPAGRYYLETLGNDVEILNALPNPVIRICGKKYKGEGVNFLTFPDGAAWTDEDIAEVTEFFTPTGRPMKFSPGQTMTALGAGAVVNPLSMFAYTIHDAWKECGCGCSDNDVAEAMRAGLEKIAGIVPKEDAPRGKIFDRDRTAFLDSTVRGFFDGLLEFLTENGFDRETAENYLYPFGDTYLHSYMRETRETIETKRKGQATKGGVVELAVNLYLEKMEDYLREAAGSAYCGVIPAGHMNKVRQFAYESAAAVKAHTSHMS